MTNEARVRQAVAEAARAALWSSFSPADLVRWADHAGCHAAPCPVCREVVAQVLAACAARPVGDE